MMNEQDLENAVAEIAHTCDGPVTAFVALIRAMRAVAAGGDPELWGNAYAQWVVDRVPHVGVRLGFVDGRVLVDERADTDRCPACRCQ